MVGQICNRGISEVEETAVAAERERKQAIRAQKDLQEAQALVCFGQSEPRLIINSSRANCWESGCRGSLPCWLTCDLQKMHYKRFRLSSTLCRKVCIMPVKTTARCGAGSIHS